MSDYLPFDIQVIIIKTLPVKSLIRFRSVSKAWKSLIDSSGFIAGYSRQQQHLLLSYTTLFHQQKYLSVVDDDTFPQQKVTLPIPDNTFECSMIIGSCCGLLCLLCNDLVVLWNPCIRRVVPVVVLNVSGFRVGFETVIGFGVGRETTDPKIVKITTQRWLGIGNVTYIPWEVEVFTLSTRAWRSPHNSPPRKSMHLKLCSVLIDGFLYWLASNGDDEYYHPNLIISFDLTSEEFREINLPDSLAHESSHRLLIFKLRESLVVLERGIGANTNTDVFHVWMMEDGFPKSFTKLFTIDCNIPYASPVGFRKTGEPIISIIGSQREALAVYEPCSKRIGSLGINE